MVPVRVLTVLLAFLLLPGTAAAVEPALPPGYVEEVENPPEDPLPPPPAELPAAPVGPVVTAPDAQELLKACEQATFTDCFRLWRPPPPPPEEEPRQALQAPSPPAPGEPRLPAVGGPLVGTPPPPDAAADRATYDALLRALKETGLDGTILMPDPPKDGSATMQLDPKPNRTAPKP